MPEPITDVIFRTWKGKDGGDVIALFPGLFGTSEPHTCSSYMHVGQHSSANPHLVIQATRPAKPHEYRDLARELRGRGYRLRIAHRLHPKYERERLDALETHAA